MLFHLKLEVTCLEEEWVNVLPLTPITTALCILGLEVETDYTRVQMPVKHGPKYLLSHLLVNFKWIQRPITAKTPSELFGSNLIQHLRQVESHKSYTVPLLTIPLQTFSFPRIQDLPGLLFLVNQL
ncbi:hypothetical protein HK096_010530, partial [Nowakowskiella sp. JEL0078]